MERLFSPWRSKYVGSFVRSGKKSPECVLCLSRDTGEDDRRLIVERGKSCFVIMNLFPYNSGHLMVVPYRHIASLTDLTGPESLEMMTSVQRMIGALRMVSHPDGFNVGSNIGRPAGAGIDGHVHMHVVPRWNGDTNFMPVLGDTKLISEEMASTFRKLRKALAAPSRKRQRK